MAHEGLNLDEQLARYNAAIEAWIVAIRREEALASSTQTTAEIDFWEVAANAEEEAREVVKKAKQAYEDALRRKFFDF